MKKWIAILSAVMVVLIAAVVVYLGFCVGYKTIYYRLYQGDRITGEITVHIDGETALFDEERTREHWNCEGDFSIVDHGVNVSLKAGDYGSYDFDIYIVGMNQPLQFSVWQLNWWNVKTFRLDVVVDTTENMASVTCFTTNISEEGSVYEDKHTWERELTEEGLTVVFD